MKDKRCKELDIVMKEKHQQLDILIEDVTKITNNFCLKPVNTTEKSTLAQFRKDVKEGQELDISLKNVIEQYVFALEPLIDEAKASVLKAVGAVLQSLR
ncbi:hypothetical protein R1flu_019042 [Riccia fluitans]|uniref:Uncharacterized protein n=1 Tax=Riccia fluitans TaxID=41844 RepID=A0ABD1ZLE9_9MARC